MKRQSLRLTTGDLLKRLRDRPGVASLISADFVFELLKSADDPSAQRQTLMTLIARGEVNMLVANLLEDALEIALLRDNIGDEPRGDIPVSITRLTIIPLARLEAN